MVEDTSEAAAAELRLLRGRVFHYALIARLMPTLTLEERRAEEGKGGRCDLCWQTSAEVWEGNLVRQMRQALWEQGVHESDEADRMIREHLEDQAPDLDMLVELHGFLLCPDCADRTHRWEEWIDREGPPNGTHPPFLYRRDDVVGATYRGSHRCARTLAAARWAICHDGSETGGEVVVPPPTPAGDDDPDHTEALYDMACAESAYNREVSAQHTREYTNRRTSIRRRILERDGHRCQICGEESHLQVDHVLALSRGGTNAPANLRTLCMACHQLKGTESPGYLESEQGFKTWAWYVGADINHLGRRDNWVGERSLRLLRERPELRQYMDLDRQTVERVRESGLSDIADDLIRIEGERVRNALCTADQDKQDWYVVRRAREELEEWPEVRQRVAAGSEVVRFLARMGHNALVRMMQKDRTDVIGLDEVPNLWPAAAAAATFRQNRLCMICGDGYVAISWNALYCGKHDRAERAAYRAAHPEDHRPYHTQGTESRSPHAPGRPTRRADPRHDGP